MDGTIQQAAATRRQGRLDDRLAQTATGVDARSQAAGFDRRAVLAGPPTEPLTAEEADLFHGLQKALAKPPRRALVAAQTDDPSSGSQPFDDRSASPIELVPDTYTGIDAPLPRPPMLPDTIDDLAALQVRPTKTVSYLQRSRRARWRSTLRHAGAWLITGMVIMATLGSAFVLVMGLDESERFFALGWAHTDSAIGILQTKIKPLLGR